MELTFGGTASYFSCRRVPVTGIFPLRSTTTHFFLRKKQKLRLAIGEIFVILFSTLPIVKLTNYTDN